MLLGEGATCRGCGEGQGGRHAGRESWFRPCTKLSADSVDAPPFVPNGMRPPRCLPDLPAAPRRGRRDRADHVVDGGPRVRPIQAKRPAPAEPHPQPIWPPRDAYRAIPVNCARLRTTSAASGAIHHRGAPALFRRMTNASVPHSVSSTSWHAVFAGHGDLEERTGSGGQVRVCEAWLATALDQRHEMTSHWALRRSFCCRQAVVDDARPSTVRLLSELTSTPITGLATLLSSN